MAMKKASASKVAGPKKPLMAKKAAVKPSAMGQSAKAHQKDLAKISGTVAMEKKMNELRKSGQRLGFLDATGAAASRATKKTAASFKKSK